jgi:hypothetical protein
MRSRFCKKNITFLNKDETVLDIGAGEVNRAVFNESLFLKSK